VGLKSVSLIRNGSALLMAALVGVGTASAESRPEVLERIKPVGTVAVSGEAAAPAAAGAAAPAVPAKPMSEGESLYNAKGCGACHGPDGIKTAMPIYPKLVGLPVKYAVNQMKDIKSGARSNGQSVAMKGIVAGVTEEEMVKMAEWLADKGSAAASAPTAKPAPAPKPAPAAAAVPAPKAEPAPAPAAGGDGASLYASKGCPACHGPSGRKALLPAYPKVAGLPAQYSLNQMKDIKSGARSNGQSVAMRGVVMGIDDGDLKTIAEWLATQ
jgi:cytochrome c553